MDRKRLTWAAVFTCMAALLVWSGCSSEKSPVASGGPGTNDPTEQTVDLDDPHGGYLAVDEAPAFGDEELAEAGLNEEAVADGFEGLDADERELARDIEEGYTARYSITLLWGNLEEHTSGRPGYTSDPVVWDGSLWVNNGAIRVVRLLGFEKPEDHLIRPRPDRSTVTWTSVTHGDCDGLHVVASLPTDVELPAGQAPDDSLHFLTGPLGEVAYPFAELENLSVILDVPNSTEKVSLTAMRIHTNPAVCGFMAGLWGWAEGDSVGRFSGRWVSSTGEGQGHLQGIWGSNTQDVQVFFGKYIDDEGHFRGFLRGTYVILSSVDPDGSAGPLEEREVGEFRGRWEDEQSNWLGDLQGTWSRVGRRPGVFSGSWRGLGITP